MYFIEDSQFFDFGGIEYSFDNFSSFPNAPTHTEDGIPIRKLYVSNLPPKTTRSDLLGVFAPYGYIKSCWLRMSEKGPNKSSIPTYAFVTFKEPGSAHKALTAPSHEKYLQGRLLRISPADSWHQPAEDSKGKVLWNHRAAAQEPNANEAQDESGAVAAGVNTENGDTAEASSSQSNTQDSVQEPESEGEISYDIIDILNTDCMYHILSYIPVHDLIRCERVSKRWHDVIQEYLQSIRLYKTSWWKHTNVMLTTAILRQVLRRFGSSLTRLHIDHQFTVLNDRTAHTIGKFCPNLTELKVVGMQTTNWNPLVYGCKELKHLQFISCSKLTDSSLTHLVKADSGLESLMIAKNTHVTGLFLSNSYPINLTSLAFYDCHSLQGTVLSSVLDAKLTTLKLDVGSYNLWKIIPLILDRLPNLVELSLSQYASVEDIMPKSNEAFIESMKNLKELKVLDLSRNINIDDAVMQQIGNTCKKLESLNVACCNSGRINMPCTKNLRKVGVRDEGIIHVCQSCSELRHLDISYLAGLSDTGISALALLPRLESVTCHGNNVVTAAGVGKCLHSCHYVEHIDICGCDNVTEEIVNLAIEALVVHPRDMLLCVAGTAMDLQTFDKDQLHPNLHVDTQTDLSNQHMRPDFVDRVFFEDSDESIDPDDLFHDPDDLFYDQMHDIDEFDIEYDNVEDYVDILNYEDWLE